MDFSRNGVVKKQHQIKSMSKRLTTKFRIAIFRIALISVAFIVIVIGVALAGSVKGMIDDAPDLSNINIDPEGYTSYIYYSNGTVAEALITTESNRVYVTIDKIPLIVQQCFVALEDERFYEHNGIDVSGIARAAVSVMREGKLKYGASTITQQVLKNRVFDGGNEKNNYDKIVRKIQEQYLAIQLEDQFTKDEILEAYINDVNLGNRSFGIQVAAQNYFGKDVGELTLSEAAVLAPIAYSPTLRNPINYPEENAERRLSCLNIMLDLGFCTKEEYEEAVADNVYDRIQEYEAQKVVESPYSYYTDTVIKYVLKDLVEKLKMTQAQATDLLYRGGIKIYTPQDKEIQEIMDNYYTKEENFPELGKGSYYAINPNYAISVNQPDGTAKHYHFDDFLEYFKDFNDVNGIYYHSGSSKKGISQYCIDLDDLNAKLDEFRAYVDPTLKNYTEGKTLDISLQPQSSMTIMDQKNGHVVAIYGGRGEKNESRSLNRAEASLRQVGSTFKVLASFLPALDTVGLTLASVADDSYYTYPNSNDKVRNWWDENVYKGLKSIREGIYNSMNIVACRVMEIVTPQVAFSYLKSLGFSSLVDNKVGEDGKVYSDIVYPLALGGLTYGVTNVEMTAAYATIANNGMHNEPVFYTKIVDRHGNTLLSNEDNVSRQVIKTSTAYLLTDAMQDATKKGTATRLKFKNYTMPVAGKTGTSTANNDLWFVGYTPYYTCAVWTGFDGNFDQAKNKTYHQDLWRNIMEEVHVLKQLENKAFDMPDNIEKREICTKCGNLAVSGLCELAQTEGEKTKVELFAKGTAPIQKCTCHKKVIICKKSNLLAGPYCPESDKEERVLLIKEETSPTWDTPYLLPKGDCNIHSSGDNIGIPMDDDENNTNPQDTSSDSQEDITIPEEEVTIPEEDITIPEEDVTIPEEDITVPEEDVTEPEVEDVET